ncbi:fibronectin type III domain-containing protein 11 [Lates calcarifer]|uniref:Fibronectin type III domain-containing protein 11 n=1 Tax=Lates calcarifer TaxID=8187 RepID=A0AAJ7LIW8_LATCA|nr:fibronectin type III domain-containing protein 11 [Lates calcarifer]
MQINKFNYKHNTIGSCIKVVKQRKRVTMDEVKLACASSDGCGAQEVRTQMDTVSDIRDQIVQLLYTRLSNNSVKVMQEELQLMQRSSYYLEIQRNDLVPTGDQQEHISQLSDGTVWSLIDQQKLQSAVTMANTQVKLLLTLLGLLYQEIIRGCQDLQDLIVKYDQGLVDSDTTATMQQKLQQTHQYVNDFKRTMTQNLCPLDLQTQLIPNTGNFPVPRLSASLALKIPVVFDRFESYVTSNSVYLCWGVKGEQSKDPNQQFEIHVKSLHPNMDEHGQLSKSICQSYDTQVTNLISDRYYQFSVKRVDTVNLVYGMWIDTIILKTLDK